MAANLTPQYLEAEAEYKRAQTAEERLACLRKMYSLLPKHKASEKLQADLKTRISEAKKEVEQERKCPKKVGVSHKIPKQGAGQYVVLGAPNTGKSRLLTVGDGLSWSSSNIPVVSITSLGLATCKIPGTATITASAPANVQITVGTGVNNTAATVSGTATLTCT